MSIEKPVIVDFAKRKNKIPRVKKLDKTEKDFIAMSKFENKVMHKEDVMVYYEDVIISKITRRLNLRERTVSQKRERRLFKRVNRVLRPLITIYSYVFCFTSVSSISLLGSNCLNVDIDFSKLYGIW